VKREWKKDSPVKEVSNAMIKLICLSGYAIATRRKKKVGVSLRED